jgi:hypothetical protein
MRKGPGQYMTQCRLQSLLLAAGMVVAFATGVQGDGPKKVGPGAMKCPSKLVCKMPSRGVDYPVCHEGELPPICKKQSDCVKAGLGAKTCTRVAPFFSLCVQACTP